jgi:dTDP-4-amino-4,6-dideoxygalactose transaminase
MEMGQMPMTERIEGRIAFLRAELGITEEQSKTWDAFAEAMRDSANRMKEAGMPMMMTGAAAADPVSQLEAQERMLAARLESVRALKAALAPLYQSLSAEQKQTANELIGPHMGLMPRGMMQGGMDMMQ